MAKRIKFAGPLAEPIARKDWFYRLLVSIAGARPTERWKQRTREVVVRENERITRLKEERMFMLAEQLGAVRDGAPDWRLLAERLAEEFVPGLRVEKYPTRGRGKPKQEFYALVRDVSECIAQNGGSVQAACHELTKMPGRWKGKDACTLERRYFEWLKDWDEEQKRRSGDPP
jgi:hypothetical protein